MPFHENLPPLLSHRSGVPASNLIFLEQHKTVLHVNTALCKTMRCKVQRSLPSPLLTTSRVFFRLGRERIQYHYQFISQSPRNGDG